MKILWIFSLLITFSTFCYAEKIRVFILAGQSNMEGQAVVSMNHEKHYNGGKGNLEWSMKHSKSKNIMKHLKDASGKWAVRDDVMVAYKDRRGSLTVGYTVYGGHTHIGPELQIGHILGNYYDDKVLLIKTAWGGKSLYKDFRPPSSGGETGLYYKKMITDVKTALAELKTDYELSGFIWQQGWNDMVNKMATAEYDVNLVNLAKDIRKEFSKPNLPVVIGELGNGGTNVNDGMKTFRRQQKKGTAKISNALFVSTVSCARPNKLSPNVSHGHHWFGNAESYFLVGDKLGKGMISLVIPPVFDTHMHLFDSTRKEGIPWPPKDDKVLYHVTLPKHFIPIAKKNKVNKVIVVQAGDRFIDNQWNLDITAPHKDLFVGIVGDLIDIGTDKFKPQLNELSKDKRFVGIRILLRHKTRKLFSGTIWEDLQLLSDKGLTLDVLMNDHKVCYSFEEVLPIAKKYPKLRVVMNHVAGYPIDGKKIKPEWAKKFREAAKHKNVYCKVSALIERSIIRPHSFETEDYANILQFLLDEFGEDRLIYGSDWPVTKYSGTYDQHKKIITDFFSQKGEKILRKVMFENAHAAYGIGNNNTN